MLHRATLIDHKLAGPMRGSPSLLACSNGDRLGLMPFLASSALKTALGAVSMPTLWRLLHAGR